MKALRCLGFHAKRVGFFVGLMLGGGCMLLACVAVELRDTVLDLWRIAMGREDSGYEQ